VSSSLLKHIHIDIDYLQLLRLRLSKATLLPGGLVVGPSLFASRQHAQRCNPCLQEVETDEVIWYQQKQMMSAAEALGAIRRACTAAVLLLRSRDKRHVWKKRT
jgi:hypothetical protein